MKVSLLAIFAAVTTSVVAAADPATDAKDAVTKLNAQPNYSWITTVEIEGAPFSPGPTKGKAEKDGFSVLTQEVNGETTEAVFKGGKGTVKLADGWKTSDELAPPGQPGGGGFDPSLMMARILLNARQPVIELEDLLSKLKDLKSGDGGVITGDLTSEGATELMRFGRRGRGGPQGQGGPPPPKNAKGTVRFWIKDGLPARYEVKVSGTVTFGPDQEEREMARTSTVEIRDVGTTKLVVPEEAKKKLVPEPR